jgi:hypothetical protein
MEKIQLQHPAGKKAIRMDEDKYNALKKSLLNHLKTKGESSHDEIFKAVNADFKKNKTTFKGSVDWHLEWVKLDLEAKKEIVRVTDKKPVTYKLI